MFEIDLHLRSQGLTNGKGSAWRSTTQAAQSVSQPEESSYRWSSQNSSLKRAAGQRRPVVFGLSPAAKRGFSLLAAS